MPFRSATFRARAHAKLLFIAALLATQTAASASASTNGSQFFLWNDRPKSPIGEIFTPNNNYMRGYNGSTRTLAMKRDDRGLYSVAVGYHDATLALQAQVVAYGDDEVRCKFNAPSKPFVCPMPDPTLPNVLCTEFFIACHSPEGTLENSSFLFSFSGNRGTSSANALAGPGAFLETTDSGKQIQKRWTNRVPVARSTALNFFNSGGGTPTIRRTSRGYYEVTIPGLGTTPGQAQVTAIGGDAVYCKPNVPFTQGTAIITRVSCFIGSTLADSNFVLNYDRYITRQGSGYQGARVYADEHEGNGYTPARSWNTGNVIDGSTGANRVYRSERGRYGVWHTLLNAQDSSAYVSAAGYTNAYCKLMSWYPFELGGVWVNINCFSSDGDPIDVEFIETYQGTVKAPN